MTIEDTAADYQWVSGATDPRVSVIIPCRNAAQWLGTQLTALSQQDYPGAIEVIVADNGSTDESGAIAARHPGVIAVDASARRGPNHARNAGAGRATGDIILTCDADDIVDPGWVTGMVRGLRRYDLVAGDLDYETLNPEYGRQAAENSEFRSRLGFLPTAAGANFGIRASVLRALGGWDEGFQGGGDDTELCWRAQLAGYRLGWADGAVVRYRLRSGDAAVAKQAYQGARWLPLMVRRFRRHGMSLRPVVVKALRYSGYLVAAAPLALFVPRIRREWLRRAALGAGVLRGLFRRDPA
jgi:cellulose synthase/poly-beta-1,6-N-acetylglucosamine synthase-like glycosyltransferase